MVCQFCLLLLFLILLSHGVIGICLLQDRASIEALAVNLRPKSRLKPRHEALFSLGGDDGDDASRLFNQLGRLCCRTGVVSRKEFLETYAAASAIHRAFPDVNRAADLASGHGLLGWFLLAMGYDNIGNRTVICIDRCMPPAAQRIATVMQDAFPLACWTYVEGDLNACQPHSSCLLTSVHACGSLTDDILHMAIAAQAPCAVVPCCHSVREGAYRPHAQYAPLSMTEIIHAVRERKQEYRDRDKHLAVANVVDQVRVQTLQRAGFDVKEVYLEDAFTARNHLVLATPPPVTRKEGFGQRVNTTRPQNQQQSFYIRHDQVVKKGQQVTYSPLIIPLDDCPDSIALCQALSGKESAKERLVQQIPRHFSLTLALSIWMDPVFPTAAATTTTTTTSSFSAIMKANGTKKTFFSTTTNTLALEDLQTMVDEACAVSPDEDRLQCIVETNGNPHVKEGRRSQLYKFKYTRKDGRNMSGLPRVQAKTMHHRLRESIQAVYGTDILR